MILTDLAAALAGVMIGAIALLLFWYFLNRLLREEMRGKVLGTTIGLLLGTAVASAPIGPRLLGEQLWPWYLVGEAAIYIPGAVFGAYWYIWQIVRQHRGRRT